MVVVVQLTSPSPDPFAGIERGAPAPDVSGTTLDGKELRLADLKGRPVIVNFWDPTCVPCRDEFPLFKAKLEQHADDRLAIVGVLFLGGPQPARDFVKEFGAAWPTVIDPDKRIQTAYRVFARPQSYFIDSAGVLRGIQVGEMREPTFDRLYATIAP